MGKEGFRLRWRGGDGGREVRLEDTAEGWAKGQREGASAEGTLRDGGGLLLGDARAGGRGEGRPCQFLRTPPARNDRWRDVPLCEHGKH